MFCATENILQNILHIPVWMWGIFLIILPVPYNTVVDLIDVMWPRNKKEILMSLSSYDEYDVSLTSMFKHKNKLLDLLHSNGYCSI